jgi:integrase
MQVLFNVLMGLRCSEIIAVKYSDIDYINRTLKIQRQLGRPRSKNYHWTHYKKLLAENGLPDIRWHDLRSTYCTLLLKNNHNPKAVSKLMGHAKEIITMDVYGDNKEMTAECIPELEAFMEEVMPRQAEQVRFREDLLDIEIDVREYLPAS